MNKNKNNDIMITKHNNNQNKQLYRAIYEFNNNRVIKTEKRNREKEREREREREREKRKIMF